MSPNNFCAVLHISKDGLKKKRYRLRKKLAIKKGVGLEAYITSL
ncbi:hypothetical protein OS188_01595 [Xanthomarina sp. F1114]|nr:hypothetical protein [Xanthomarina sp. F1114]MCX7546640.1 hypothetical protein [Xanthomarina sp. F1114]